MPSLRLLFFALSVFVAGSTVARSADAVRDKYVEAELIADVSAIEPGVPFTLVLKLSIDPTWHTYWINPGATGLPTSLKLDLPEGFTAGALQFPLPKKFITDYGFGVREAGLGYEKSVLHPMQITPPAGLKPGDRVILKGRASWLMCDPNTCVPGKADISIDLSVGESAASSPEAASIAEALAKLPATQESPLVAALEGSEIVASGPFPEPSLPEGAKSQFFPIQKDVLDLFAEATVTVAGGKVTIRSPKHESLTEAPATLSGVLVVESGGEKRGFAFPESATPPPPPGETATSDGTVSADGAAETGALPFGGGLLGILLAAFLGGVILNVMPCVFPVISLKVMSFVGQAGEDRKKVFLHALAFALGVLVFFWGLTTAMLVLRGLGSDDLGWGVQLRHPGFVIGLIFVMVIVALSLFGVFEIGASMTAVGGSLATKAGYAGSFWSGALAVLLATPCTAPLMAPAIGFALSQSAPVMFLIFTTLGLGLAAPYFLFAIFPKLLDLIPAPGAWMETFKQFMGFPMLAVAVWLIGVLSKQLSVGGLQWALASVLFVSVAAWILGRFTGFDRPRASRVRARIAALVVFAVGLGIAWSAAAERAPAPDTDLGAVIAQHRAEGHPVFVDFTAEWCVTCKVNERVAIRNEAVQKAFDEKGIVFVVADWTNEDPAIAKILADHGRAGVPLYLLYPADSSKPAIQLKDGFILPGDILEAIDRL